jgi:hypothetical protein
MGFPHNGFATTTVAVVAVFGTPAIAHASTLTTTNTYNLNFETSNQSVWDTGDTFAFNDFRVLGPEGTIGDSFSIKTPRPRIGICPFCVRLPSFTLFEAAATLDARLESNLNISGGAVNAFLPVDLSLITPDFSEQIKPGDTFTISSAFSFGDSATFNTSSPEASYSLDAVFGAKLFAGFPGFGFDSPIGTIGIPPVTVPNPPINIETQRRNLVSFDSSNTGDVSVFEQPPFSLTASVPQVNTTGSLLTSNQLTSFGEDEFLTADLNLVGLVGAFFGIPPEVFSGNVDLGFTSLNYDLVNLALLANLKLQQEFSLIGELPGLLALEDGTRVPFKVGQDITLTMPKNIGSFLDIDVFLDLDALFSNTTSIGLSGGYDLALGRFDIGNINLLVTDFNPDPFSIFDPDAVDYNIASFPPIYSNQFQLAGFNQQQVSFKVRTTPEPSIVTALLSINLIGVSIMHYCSRISRKRNY